MGIRNNRLDLDDQHDARQSMEGEDVDRATLAPDREGDLDGDLPAGRTKHDDERVDEPSVRLVDQSVECFTIPSKANIDSRTDRSGDGPERGDRHRLDVTRFDLRY